MSNQDSNVNEIYRKPDCPWGKKAVTLLDNNNIEYKDHTFSDKDEENAFKEKHEVKTTPQVFLKGERIGGYTELSEHLNDSVDDDEDGTSYLPVIAVFSTAALMALATQTWIMGFMGFSLCLLACLKLMDIPAFIEGFKKYDLLTKAIPVYGWVYPFAELFAGLGFLSGLVPNLVGSVSLFVGLVGGVSIFKAVYIDKTDLSCACIGGNSNVPLGVVSISENVMMAVMGVWLLI
jgi:glutaredoxin